MSTASTALRRTLAYYHSARTMHEVERVCGISSALYLRYMHPHSTNRFDTQGNVQTYQIDGDQKEVRSSDTAVNSAFIGGLLVLSRFPVRSPPPVFGLLVMMFGLTDAACDGNHCCYNSDCATSWCLAGGGVSCKCKSEWFKNRWGTGSCQAKRTDGQTAHYSGLPSTPDYNSCQARNGRYAASPPYHILLRPFAASPHFTVSCPDVASAD